VRSKDYGEDVLTAKRVRRRPPVIEAESDLVLEDISSGFCGAIVVIDRGSVTLEDRHGRRRVFPYAEGAFLLDGQRVTLTRPKAQSPIRSARTASGSVAVGGAQARVAIRSRILVEGVHDAELVEAIWGADLRLEGVVVERLDGADNLAEFVRSFRPGPHARLGVLLDHLVSGSKESRIAAQVSGPHVLVVGHPFVDIWQAVLPSRLGHDAWPVVPRELDWKHGVCAAWGWPHADQADIAAAWKRILGRVRSYTDLEPALLGPVERLIDFVTAATDDR
jgi:hypothetical protein